MAWIAKTQTADTTVTHRDCRGAFCSRLADQNATSATTTTHDAATTTATANDQVLDHQRREINFDLAV